MTQSKIKGNENTTHKEEVKIMSQRLLHQLKPLDVHLIAADEEIIV